MKAIKYCARAVVRHLNGDMNLFNIYRNKAIQIYEEENGIVTIGELIPAEIKVKLYEMVS